MQEIMPFRIIPSSYRKETWDHVWAEDLIVFGADSWDLFHRQGTNLAISNKESTPLDSYRLKRRIGGQGTLTQPPSKTSTSQLNFLCKINAKLLYICATETKSLREKFLGPAPSETDGLNF